MNSQQMIQTANQAIEQAEPFTQNGLLYNRYIRECRYVLQMRVQQVEQTSWWGTDVEGMKQRSLGYPLAELLCALENKHCTMKDVETKHNSLLGL